MKDAARDKQFVALTSVVAAMLLTGTKIVVGLATNSLGILSEAAHSGLDLVAAVVTLLAVRFADKPADLEHPYGHGKMENLSALFQALLLLGTCVWIVWESVERLWFTHVHVDASFWSFAVMFLSIAVDYGRSRALSRAAREHNSQALEADALHFSTDIYSSMVVIVGLCGVTLSHSLPAHAWWLGKTDAVAALGVAVIVVGVSVQLGRRTLQALTDRAPAGLADRIKPAVEALHGVEDCHHIRVRTSGPYLFIDVHVLIDGTKTLNEVHEMTEHIEDRIREVAPNADVVVHPEPIDVNR